MQEDSSIEALVNSFCADLRTEKLTTFCHDLVSGGSSGGKKSFGKIIFFNREDRNQGVQSKNVTWWLRAELLR
jgi:hypothetical protein